MVIVKIGFPIFQLSQCYFPKDWGSSISDFPGTCIRIFIIRIRGPSQYKDVVLPDYTFVCLHQFFMYCTYLVDKIAGGAGSDVEWFCVMRLDDDVRDVTECLTLWMCSAAIAEYMCVHWNSQRSSLSNLVENFDLVTPLYALVMPCDVTELHHHKFR